MFYLLDINVLIASADPAHQFHAAFNIWYASKRLPSLATCPITENGFLRIYGHPDYPGGPGSPALARAPLMAIRNRPTSIFLADDVSLLDKSRFIQWKNATPKQLTDMYLLGLALRHQGKFASFDREIQTTWVDGGRTGIELISN